MDFYKLLGVSPTASKEDIKKAFREKAKKYHPDLNPKNQELFKKIIEAYETLTDDNKRREYDLKRKSNFVKNRIEEELKDFLNIKNNKKLKGKDIKRTIFITLKEGFEGSYKKISYTKKKICPNCDGRGTTANSFLQKCSSCKGSGSIKKWLINIPCIKCKGKGYLIINPCEYCGGEGLIRTEVEKSFYIPPGIQENHVIKLEEDGNEVYKGIPGDLLIKIKFNKSKDIKIKDKDIYRELKLPKEKAKAGEYIFIKNFKNETISIKLPENINKETVLKIKGEGYKNINGEIGDLYLKIVPI